MAEQLRWEDECSLLDAWGIIVQGLLGVSALSTLVYKRLLEVPRRPRLIWFFDTSKQAASASVGHMLNVLLSERVLVRLHVSMRSPCAWYLVNLVLDTTVGTIVAFYVLRTAEAMLDVVADCAGGACAAVLLDASSTGHYGTPPSCWRWGLQLVLWLVVTITTKAIISAMIIMAAVPLHSSAATTLSPLEHYPRIQATIVVLVVPLGLNVMQFWIQDSFLKLRRPSSRRSDSIIRFSVHGGAELSGYSKCSTAPVAVAPSGEGEVRESTGLMRETSIDPGTDSS